MKPKYIITTGWWCENTNSGDNREKFNGAEDIRKVEFFDKWYKAIKKFTHAQNIVIIDSNSPIKPDIINKEDVKMVSLQSNAGHSTNHKGKICGVTRAHLLGMSYVLCSDVDYWVYIEQDALIFGKDIIETAISESKKGIIFGCGWKTPQPTQQSLMIIHKDYIAKFIERYLSISKNDNEISPEMKFAIASTWWARLLPELAFLENKNGSRIRGYWLRALNYAFNNFGGYDKLPFGYGRDRPIDFNDTCFYFQHGTTEELEKHEVKINI